jgi:haloacetate dehalogenase
MTATEAFLPGFAEQIFNLGDVEVFGKIGGSGPPLLLLHGYPATHLAWHHVAPCLARKFTVVAPDLRGYGSSSCPPSDNDHRTYSKRVMAHDMVRYMNCLGFRRFSIMGHNRGARVAYRLALDWPDAVDRLVLLDIMTTYDQWQPPHQSARERLFHWAFLAQPAPLPETLIAADPVSWVASRFRRGTLERPSWAMSQHVLEAYCDMLREPDRIHATCEDFRAGATCDLADDVVDRKSRRRIQAPTLVIWARSGNLTTISDPQALWQPWCTQLETALVDGGHFIPEENPTGLLQVVLPFLSEPNS